MAEPNPPSTLVRLADQIRSALREADALQLLDVGIHLDAALNALALRDGAIGPEPYDLPD